MEKVLGRFILIISKKNEVYLNIKTEPNYARELSDFFTFEVPGARFMPSYRNKYWDGKIRLFNQMNGEVYVGLLPYIEEFAKRNEIDIVYKENVNGQQELGDGELDTFVSFYCEIYIVLFRYYQIEPSINLFQSIAFLI